MTINRRTLLKNSAAGLLAAQAMPFVSSGASAATFARIGSGFGGTYAIFCPKLAELMNANMKDVHATAVSGGTEQNLVKVQQGEAEFSICYTFHSDYVAKGNGELGVPTPDLRHVFSLYSSHFVPFTHKDSPINDLSDVVANKARVWLSSRSSVLWVMNEKALNAYGVTLDQLTAGGGVVDTTAFNNVVQSFQDNQLDVAFMSGPQPYAILIQLDESVGFKALGFSEEAGKKYTELLPGTEIVTLPGGTYKSQPEDIKVPFVYNHLVAGAAVPDEVVYGTAKVIWDNYEQFHGLFSGSNDIKPENALRLNTLPIHPGAEAFFKEKGLL